MGRGPIPGVGPCHHEWGHILGGGVTSLGVEPHRWDRAMSLQVKPLHGGGATAPVVGPRHCGWGHVIGVGLPHWGVAMLLNVGPSHWGWAHLTGMEPPHWGCILISGDAHRGEARAATLRCVSETISALPPLCLILVSTCPCSWDHTSQCADLEGKCNNSMLSHTCKCAHTCVYRPVLLQRFQPQTWGHGNPLTYPYLGPENWRQKV